MADIFGYSMGGCVGLHLARHHPDPERLDGKVPGTPHPFDKVDQELLAFHIRQFFSKGQPR
jgi:pimeloyl-ACP methyl ester carboxylesterase